MVMESGMATIPVTDTLMGIVTIMPVTEAILAEARKKGMIIIWNREVFVGIS
jgi:hypothetical protein